MQLLLGILLFSFLINAVLIIPFIDFLYHLKLTRRNQQTKDPLGKRTHVFDFFNKQKAGIPVGGGILIILTQSFLFFLILTLFDLTALPITHVYPFKAEIFVLFACMLGFGLIGLYDDLLKFFRVQKRRFFGLRFKTKLLIQLALAFLIAAWLYFQLGINFIYLGPLGVVHLSIFYIPFAALFIVFFANAFNITDGLDGLSTGLLLFNLLAFWFLSATILDNILGIFLAIWIGGILSFLYFNIYPARIMLGDVGALSFGATLALIGLLLGKILPVILISSPYIIEALSSLIQLFGKKYLNKKPFPVAPLHLWLQKIGWEEPKIVARAWLAQIVLAVIGLWLSLF
ncbi:MAG: hypothetical protein GXP43_03690 [bacterium]|nr:hypothetical protein [bacterium]